MPHWVIWSIILAAAVVSIALWFRASHRTLSGFRAMVADAARQLEYCRRKAGENDIDPAVLRRSENICRQAEMQYYRVLHRPLMYLPGKLMGFGSVPRPRD